MIPPDRPIAGLIAPRLRGTQSGMSTLDHIGINVSDQARSKAFYEKALAPLGIAVIMEHGTWCGFGRENMPDFWIVHGPATYQKPAQVEPITPVHVCFKARSRAEVDGFHRAALAAASTPRDASRRGRLRRR